MDASAASRVRGGRGEPVRTRPIPTRMHGSQRAWEDRGSMSVIARIPRLGSGVDGGPVPSRPAPCGHDAPGASAASIVAPGPQGDGQRPGDDGRPRTRRRFPVATTVILAAAAAACWLAVWLQERRGEALDAAMTGAVAEVAGKDGVE